MHCAAVFRPEIEMHGCIEAVASFDELVDVSTLESSINIIICTTHNRIALVFLLREQVTTDFRSFVC